MNRTHLPAGFVLTLDRDYIIESCSGSGSTSIAFRGYYKNARNQKCPVLIKELYPGGLEITRTEDGELCIPSSSLADFQAARSRFEKDFIRANDLRSKIPAAMPVDLYEKNSTLYSVQTWMEGHMLNGCSIQQASQRILSLAKTVSILHEAGYAGLDLKPDNIWITRDGDVPVLLDFDSMSSTGSSPSRYSFSWISPNTSDDGKASDIYALGALLYWMIYQKPVRATDCEEDARFELSNVSESCRLKLEHVFHKTLNSYPPSRYQTVTEMIPDLEKLASLSQEKVWFVPRKIRQDLSGRKEELERLESWRESDEPVLQLCGPGGIGKSVLARSFASRNDRVLWCLWHGSFDQTLLDEQNICIHNVQRDPLETREEWLERKKAQCRALAQGWILIVDNFDGINQDLSFLEYGWKVLLVSRTSLPFVPSLTLQPIIDRSFWKQQASSILERKVEEEEIQSCLDLCQGLPLAMSLMIHQAKASHLDLTKACSQFCAKLPFEHPVFQWKDGFYKEGPFLSFVQAALPESLLLWQLACFGNMLVPEALKASLPAWNNREYLRLEENGWIHDGLIHPLVIQSLESDPSISSLMAKKMPVFDAVYASEMKEEFDGISRMTMVLLAREVFENHFDEDLLISLMEYEEDEAFLESHLDDFVHLEKQESWFYAADYTLHRLLDKGELEGARKILDACKGTPWHAYFLCDWKEATEGYPSIKDMDRAIRAMKPYKKRVESLKMGKAMLLVRLGKPQKGLKLLDEIEDHACEKEIARAWALPGQCLEHVEKALTDSKTGLDRINYVLIPCAEVLFCNGCFDQSLELFRQMDAICDERKDLAAMNRKKEEISQYRQEVLQAMQENHSH